MALLKIAQARYQPFHRQRWLTRHAQIVVLLLDLQQGLRQRCVLHGARIVQMLPCRIEHQIAPLFAEHRHAEHRL